MEEAKPGERLNCSECQGVIIYALCHALHWGKVGCFGWHHQVNNCQYSNKCYSDALRPYNVGDVTNLDLWRSEIW